MLIVFSFFVFVLYFLGRFAQSTYEFIIPTRLFLKQILPKQTKNNFWK